MTRPSTTRPRLSVVIPTRDRARFLERTLAACARQELPARFFEVIVVDNGSTDGTGAAVAAFARRGLLRLRLVREPKRGAAAARNAGARASRGGVVVFLDDTCMPHSACLRAYDRAHREKSGRVLVGSVEGAISCWSRDALAGARGVDGPLPTPKDGREHWFFSVDDVLARFPDMPLFPVRWHGAEKLRRGHPLDWRNFHAANFSVARSEFERHGGFDERFRGWGLEDGELCYRLQKAGLRFEPLPAALCYHQLHPAPARARQSYRRNMKLFVRLHPEAATAAFRRESLRWVERHFA